MAKTSDLEDFTPVAAESAVVALGEAPPEQTATKSADITATHRAEAAGGPTAVPVDRAPGWSVRQRAQHYARVSPITPRRERGQPGYSAVLEPP